MELIRKKVSSIKRGKMFFLSVFILLGTFLFRVLRMELLSRLEILTLAVIAGLIAYLGMLWVINFKVTKSRIFIVVLQVSFFVFLEVLFLQTYFMNEFDRIYKVVLFVGMSTLLMGLTYGIFLMGNIFIVSCMKAIPLENVAKTVSYIASLMMVQFITFTVLTIEVNLIIFVLALLISYFLIVKLHFFNIKSLGVSHNRVVEAIVLSMFSITIGLSQIRSIAELISMVPVVVMFSMFNVLTAEKEEQRIIQSIWSLVNIVVIIFLVIWFSGRGGIWL